MHKLKSVRNLDLGVAGLSADFNAIFEKILREALIAVQEDGAHVIVFGCTGMRRYAEKLAGELYGYGVPVVEPITTAVNLAEILVRLRLRPSKVTYPKPADKRRVF